MSFAVIEIIIIKFLTSESFLVKPLHHRSAMRSPQKNNSALRQSFYWVCTFHASVKMLQAVQVALRAVFFSLVLTIL